MFSRSCQYALQAVLYITLHQKKKSNIGLKEISSSQDIPLHFLSKILQSLVKADVLTSIKGPNGGFRLNISPDELKLLEIVRIIDGLSVFERCGIGMKICSDERPCPIHNDYKKVRNKIKEIFSQKTLTELIEDVEEGKSIVSFVNMKNRKG